jgi:PAS domain S-box-containing protein
MSGYTEEELTGTPVLDITYPEDRERSQELSFQVLTGVIAGFTLEKRYLKKDGGFFWVQMTATAVHDSGGKVIFALGIVEDITARKRAQEALAKEQRNLRRLLHSSDHERQLIAYEIHDGLAQKLAGAIMQFQTFDYLKDKKPGLAAKAFTAGTTMLEQSHYETRRLIAGVRPPILDEEGITAAVGHLVNEQIRLKGPKIEYRRKVEFDRLDRTLENAIYRITQEALTNACAYSKSERISVSILQRGERVRIDIRDWGVGFDPKAVPKNHFGLEGIRQRARLLGGKCSIRSAVGKGTRVTVELRVVPKNEEE